MWGTPPPPPLPPLRWPRRPQGRSRPSSGGGVASGRAACVWPAEPSPITPLRVVPWTGSASGKSALAARRGHAGFDSSDSWGLSTCPSRVLSPLVPHGASAGSARSPLVANTTAAATNVSGVGQQTVLQMLNNVPGNDSTGFNTAAAAVTTSHPFFPS